MRILFSIPIAAILTIIVGYFLFYPPNTPPDYVYLLIFLVFFGILYGMLTLLKRRKKDAPSQEN